MIRATVVFNWTWRLRVLEIWFRPGFIGASTRSVADMDSLLVGALGWSGRSQKVGVLNDQEGRGAPLDAMPPVFMDQTYLTSASASAK